MKNPLKAAAGKVRAALSRSSSRPSQRSTSSRGEPSFHNTEEHTHEEEQEQEPNEEAQPLRTQDPETGLWLTAQEMVSLNTIRHRQFEHTKVIDPELLHRTGMDEEFFEVFGAIGWGEFWDSSEYSGSRLLTLEFMSTVKATADSIYFCLHGHEFNFD